MRPSTRAKLALGSRSPELGSTAAFVVSEAVAAACAITCPVLLVCGLFVAWLVFFAVSSSEIPKKSM